MALIEWKDAYSLDIVEIDDQHRKLIDLINRLHSAILTGRADITLGEILTDLVYYTIYHFETEEKFFDEYDYPEAEQHKKQHKSLIDQVAALQKQHESGEKVLTMDIMNFLRDWLQDHILGSDLKFGPFLKSKGVN